MTKSAFLFALPLALAISACGNPDGGDTADLAPDAVTAGTGEATDTEYQPGEDGPLQNDVVPGDEPVEPVPVEAEDAASTESESTGY